MVESFVDELAIAAAVDPAAFRLAMLKDKPRHAAVLQAVLEMGGPLGRAGGDGPTDPAVGRGIAPVERFGSIVAQIAEGETMPGQRPRVRPRVVVVELGRVHHPSTVVST